LAGKADEIVVFFLQKIEQAAVLTNWTPEVRLTVVRQFLTDEALNWSQTDDYARTTIDYELFQTCLKNGHKKNTTRYYREFLSFITIQRDEDIEVFADRIRSTNSKIYLLTDNADVNAAFKYEADQRALDTFLNGLTGELGDTSKFT
jgi:hypothetical protein